jgi:hypothetical protein
MTVQTLMIEKTVQLEEVQVLVSRLAPIDKLISGITPIW